MNIGQEIKRLRESREWSQSKLAILADVSQSKISRLENGKQIHVTPKILEQFVNAFEVDVSELTGKTKSPSDVAEFMALPKGTRGLILALFRDHRDELKQWLDVYEKASPRRRAAILEAHGEDDQDQEGGR